MYEFLKAFIMTNDVRWGTHYREFQLILDNKHALLLFSVDECVDLNSSVTIQAIAITL